MGYSEKQPRLPFQPWIDPRKDRDQLNSTPRANTRDPEIETPPCDMKWESVDSKTGNLGGYESGSGKGS